MGGQLGTYLVKAVSASLLGSGNECRAMPLGRGAYADQSWSVGNPVETPVQAQPTHGVEAVPDLDTCCPSFGRNPFAMY
jgi:hypothetical protein